LSSCTHARTLTRLIARLGATNLREAGRSASDLLAGQSLVTDVADQHDPEYARALEPDDLVRICRALNLAGAEYVPRR